MAKEAAKTKVVDSGESEVVIHPARRGPTPLEAAGS